ncbi:MAG TPA: pyridoxamine 5'-phosphate oxidase family protein [Candidatus Parabacteroides intestinigallinarum]|uniref:Pyridoxamine 5'-phosphate oxidase family protein n=1 Tax=Candidatus Parabacteroides intestinigallinarum TaxID=2838722 RepID=A0A9D2BNH0_9BACT|nr:pyridoxamine 5'-phosphate oxidase family protein [Candidatus Parabacteroides intestinigallinarum]
MEKAFDFLSGHKDVAFATVEQDKPKIRVFQIMRQEGHTLYFATSPRKEVYRQLRENPHVELLAMDGDISVRLTGCAVFDVPDALAREIYADNPVLPRLYKRYTDLVYFRLPIAKLDYYDLSPTPPVFEHYEFGEPV